MRNPALRPCEPSEAVGDVPLPHDLVGDLLAAGPLSHTLFISQLPFFLHPRPRVQICASRRTACVCDALPSSVRSASLRTRRCVRGSKMYQTVIEDHRKVLCSIPMPALYSLMAPRRHNTPHRRRLGLLVFRSLARTPAASHTPPQKAGGLASVTDFQPVPRRCCDRACHVTICELATDILPRRTDKIAVMRPEGTLL
jgi:hypothetical protein